MRKTIFTAALALLLLSCSEEPEINFSNTVTQKSEDYELGIPYDFPVENQEKPGEINYVKITLKCKKYLNDTDWQGVGIGSDGMYYVVKSTWTMIVDIETGKPKNKQIISATVVLPPAAGLPC